MARGYIYEVCTKIDNIGFMDESDFYELCGHEADYFSDLEITQEESERNDFLEDLKKHGVQYGTEEADLRIEGPEEIPWVIFSQEAKESYFKDRFERMKKLAAEITLEQFATDAYNLKRLISDDYGAAVYLNSSFYTLDYFIREAEPGKKYYIGNVVLMH